MPGSAPNRDLHNPSLSTTTGAALGRSSSTVKARPIRGAIRNTSKNDAVTLAACTICGLSGPVKLHLLVPKSRHAIEGAALLRVEEIERIRHRQLVEQSRPWGGMLEQNEPVGVGNWQRA